MSRNTQKAKIGRRLYPKNNCTTNLFEAALHYPAILSVHWGVWNNVVCLIELKQRTWQSSHCLSALSGIYTFDTVLLILFIESTRLLPPSQRCNAQHNTLQQSFLIMCLVNVLKTKRLVIIIVIKSKNLCESFKKKRVSIKNFDSKPSQELYCIWWQLAGHVLKEFCLVKQTFPQ